MFHDELHNIFYATEKLPNKNRVPQQPLHIKNIQFSFSPAFLPNSSDSGPAIAEQRKKEVDKNRKVYKWGTDPMYTHDLPGFIEAKDPKHLPKDVQFTDEATLSLFDVGLNDLENLGLAHLYEIWESWDSLEDFREVITPVIQSGLPHSAEYWRDDVWFGAQFLNGSNPEVIRQCKALPVNFPVKDEMVAQLLDRGYNLNKAMQVTTSYLHYCLR